MEILWNIEKKFFDTSYFAEFQIYRKFFLHYPSTSGGKNFDLAYFFFKERVFLLTEVVFGEAGAETLLLVTLGPVLPFQVRVAL